MKEIITVCLFAIFITFSMIGYNIYSLSVQADLYKACLEVRKANNTSYNYCTPPR